MNWNRILPAHPCDAKTCPQITGRPQPNKREACENCRLKERIS